MASSVDPPLTAEIATETIWSIMVHDEGVTFVIGVRSTCCSLTVPRSLVQSQRRASDSNYYRDARQTRAGDSSITWTEVSRLMGYTHGRQQCSTKWYIFSRRFDDIADLSFTGWSWLKSSTTGVPNLSGLHKILVCFWKGVLESSVTCEMSYLCTFKFRRIGGMMFSTGEADIHWNKLAESYDHVWSLSSLRRKWSTLKSSINGSDCMTSQGRSVDLAAWIVDYLDNI